MKRIKSLIHNGTEKFLRFLISFVIFILPRNSAYNFLEISIHYFFARNINFEEPGIDTRKFFNFIHDDKYTQEESNLPDFTLKYIWSNDFLNSVKRFDTGKYPVREILSDPELFGNNIDGLVGCVIENLPLLVKLRLDFDKPYVCDAVKKEISNSLHKKLLHS